MKNKLDGAIAMLEGIPVDIDSVDQESIDYAIVVLKKYKELQEPKDFIDELKSLINSYSKENDSNTPDFILAQYLNGCLEAFNAATQQRENWYKRDPRPSEVRAGNE